MVHLHIGLFLVMHGLFWIPGPVHSLDCPSAKEDDELVYEGETFKFNCTGNEPLTNITCFIRSQGVTAEIEVDRLMDETIQISAKNVSFSPDSPRVIVFDCNGADYYGHLARRPLPIVGPHCHITYPTLSCSWAPNAIYQRKHVTLGIPVGLQINTMVHWNQSDGKNGYFNFTDGDVKQNDFTLNSSVFAFGEIISVSVSVKITRDRLHLKSPEVIFEDHLADDFNTSLIVKPGPVRHLACSPGSRNATCSWVLPSERHALTVNVKLTPSNMTWNDTSISQLFIEDLKPNTNYEVHVSAVPVQGGFQSEVRQFHFKTKPDAPGGHPLTTPGSFWVHDCFEEHCEVTVYFQPLEREILHSDHHEVNYNISLNGQPRCENQTATVQHGESSVDFRISQTCDYNLTLVAYNDLGESPAPRSVLRLQRNDESLVAPSIIVRRRSDHTAVLQWKAGCHSDRDYTVFWCQERNKMCYTQDDPVHWQRVGNKCDMTVTLLNGRSLDDTLFAISVEVNNASSGLNWAAQHHYDDTQKPDRPVLHGEVIQDSQFLSLKWQPQKCAARKCKAYITSYNIAYCTIVNCSSSQECSGTKKYISESHLTSKKNVGVSSGIYSVTVEALSFAGSVQSKAICLTVEEKWFRSWWFIPTIIASGCFGIILVVAGFITCTGSCKDIYKWFKEGVGINVPQRQSSIQSSGTTLL